LLAERSPPPIATGEIEATRCGFANLHVQLAAATPNCTTVEYFPLSEGIYSFEELVSNPHRPKDGHITLNQAPGIGIELDWEAVSHHAIAGTAGQR
jgi:L-alanine-DL-glutamate epimerase-like enolase superfamily enzyme